MLLRLLRGRPATIVHSVVCNCGNEGSQREFEEYHLRSKRYIIKKKKKKKKGPCLIAKMKDREKEPISVSFLSGSRKSTVD